jgi:hypothetical protein
MIDRYSLLLRRYWFDLLVVIGLIAGESPES